jgi:hypothetical protein
MNFGIDDFFKKGTAVKNPRTSRDVCRKPRKDGLIYEESPQRGRKRARTRNVDAYNPPPPDSPELSQPCGESKIHPGRWEAMHCGDTAVQVQPGHAPPVPNITVLLRVPSGTISTEIGADGTYLRFDCDCLDALPYCKAACCSLCDTIVTDEEVAGIGEPLVARDHTGQAVMRRRSDGYCCCNDPTTKLCTIYDDRPLTCSLFHCCRNPTTRGWVCRLNRIDH